MHSAIKNGQKSMAMILMVMMKIATQLSSSPRKKRKAKRDKRQCKLKGNVTHLRTNRKNCPYSKKLNNASTPPHKDDDASSFYNNLSDDMSPAGDNSSDESESASSDDWCFEVYILSGDVCLWSPCMSTQKRLSHELEYFSYRSVRY